MKLIGAVLVLCACVSGGCYAAGRLEHRVKVLQTLIQLTDSIMTELQSRLPFIAEMLPELAGRTAFSGLRFLQDAAANAGQFPESWNDAVTRDPALSDESKAVMITVGQTLGSTTLDGQISALHLCEKRLSALHADTAEYAKQKGALCRSFGFLGGIFLVILLL